MSKMHLKKSGENYGSVKTECGIEIIDSINTVYNWEDVKCENCKRTKLYKKLKADAEYKKEIKKEMEDIKKIAEWKNKFSVGDKVVIEDEEIIYNVEITEIAYNGIFAHHDCTYWVFYLDFKDITSIEFQNPKEKFKELPRTYKQKVEIEIEVEEGKEVFDYSILGKSNVTCDALNVDIYTRDKAKQGVDLIDCLCYISDNGIDTNNLGQYEVAFIIDYCEVKQGFFNGFFKYNTNIGFVENAYPVSEEKLKELKEALNK